MPSLQVRDFPDELYSKLQSWAQMEHRSLAQETIVLLKKALEEDSSRQESRKKLLAEIEKTVTEDYSYLPSPAEIVRGDRNRFGCSG